MRHAAHDLRNLHTIAIGHCELADREVLHGEFINPNHIRVIRGVLGQCNEIIASFFFPTPLAPGTFDLNALVRKTVAFMADDAPGLTVNLCAEPPLLIIAGSSLAMSRILLNLILNAHAAILAGGRGHGAIVLATGISEDISEERRKAGNGSGENSSSCVPAFLSDHHPQSAILTVTDNGCGMSLLQQRLLLRPWLMQLDGPHAPSHGHGNRIVRKAVDELGGAMTIASTEGVGAVFAITLPMQNISQESRKSGKEILV